MGKCQSIVSYNLNVERNRMVKGYVKGHWSKNDKLQSHAFKMTLKLKKIMNIMDIIQGFRQIWQQADLQSCDLCCTLTKYLFIYFADRRSPGPDSGAGEEFPNTIDQEKKKKQQLLK